MTHNTDRRQFLRRAGSGLLVAAAWLASADEIADWAAWQDRRIFALGALPPRFDWLHTTGEYLYAGHTLWLRGVATWELLPTAQGSSASNSAPIGAACGAWRAVVAGR